MTGQTRRTTVGRVFEAGFDAYLPKPVDAPELARVVRHLVVDRQMRDAS